jgi:hypothetical protein
VNRSGRSAQGDHDPDQSRFRISLSTGRPNQSVLAEGEDEISSPDTGDGLPARLLHLLAEDLANRKALSETPLLRAESKGQPAKASKK